MMSTIKVLLPGSELDLTISGSQYFANRNTTALGIMNTMNTMDAPSTALTAFLKEKVSLWINKQCPACELQGICEQLRGIVVVYGRQLNWQTRWLDQASDLGEKQGVMKRSVLELPFKCNICTNVL